MGIALAITGTPGSAKGLYNGYDVGWFAPNYKLLDEAWRAAKRALTSQNLIARIDAQQRRIELGNNAALDFWTLEDQDAGRGRRYGTVLLDEAAMARYLREAWDAAIRPTLTDFEGSGWFLSTPKGRNFFYELAQRGQSEHWPDWAYHHAPTSANPYIPPAEIEHARKSLPERIFAQEYLAQFLEDEGGVFRRIMAAVDPELTTNFAQVRARSDGRAYVIGVDWGRNNDFTVISVIDARDNALVYIDRFTGVDYAMQLARLRTVHERFPRAPILAEANSMGGPLIEQLQRMRLPVRAFQTTNASKAAAIETLGLAFERGVLRIPQVQWLIEELMGYEQERLPSGAIRYGAPRGGHDDGVMSLAIAWSGIASAANPLPVTMMVDTL